MEEIVPDLWLYDVCEKLFIGNEKLQLVSPRRTGKSVLLRQLVETAKEIGFDTGQIVHVDGRTFTESDFNSEMNELFQSCKAALTEHGQLTLLFDSYGHAIRRTGAKKLQARLFSNLINSKSSHKISCIFAYRSNQMADLRIQASSFLSRLTYQPLPRMSKHVSSYPDSQTMSKAIGVVGESIPMVALALEGHFGDGGVSLWENTWSSLAAGFAQDLPTPVFHRLANDSDWSEFNAEEIEKLLSPPGENRIGDQYTHLRAAAKTFIGPWPCYLSDSADRFARLLQQTGSSYWVDRYGLSPDLHSELEEFVRLVRARAGDSTIRILFGYNTRWDFEFGSDARSLANDLIERLNTVKNVEIRVINRTDWSSVHDRHLISTLDSTGFSVPDCREILGRVTRETSRESALSSTVGVYSAMWRRATLSVPPR